MKVHYIKIKDIWHIATIGAQSFITLCGFHSIPDKKDISKERPKEICETCKRLIWKIDSRAFYQMKSQE